MNEGDLENPKIELQGKLNLIYERIDVGGSALEKKKIVFKGVWKLQNDGTIIDAPEI